MRSSTFLDTPATSGHGRRKALAMFSAVVLIAIALYAARQSPPSSATAAQDKSATARAVAAAKAFLDTLGPKEGEKALYDFDNEKKSKWSNLPVTMVARNGVRLGDMTKEQREKAMGVVAAVLSKEGYQKVIDIVDSDQKLADQAKGGKGKGKGSMFGADQYYLAIFGPPSETKPWMVQFGGHHLGINVTVIGKHFILTPTHTGAQPTLFKRDGKDVHPLGLENDTGFKLVNALDEKQRAQAILAAKPQQELLLGPGRDGKKIDPEGIKGAAMTAEQKVILLDLIAAWVNITEPDTARARMAANKEKIGETYFAWRGPTENGSAAYFRVQGPTVIIEYAPQGNTDHIHTVIRNPEDDYGAGLVKK